MPAEPLNLTRATLAAYRSGVPVAVAEGMAASIPKQRPGRHETFRRRGALWTSDAVVSAAPVAAPGPGVAVLQVRGVITQREEWSSCGEACNYDEIAARYCDAHVDPGVGALVLDTDSPGGDVAGGEEGHEKMRAAKAASGKLVVGYVGALCASAAQWLLAAVCDVIVCHPSALLGSVGVVLEHETDARKALADGYDRTIFRFPPGKANPSSAEVLDVLGAQRLTDLVTAPGERFVAQLAAYRGIDPAAILAWNGAILPADQAVAGKLADMLGTLESAIAYAGTFAALGAS